MSCDYSMLHKIGKVFFRLLETNGFHVKARNEGFPVEARLVIRTSNMKIPRRHLADYVIKLHQKACPACSTIIFSLQPIKRFISSVVVLAVTPFSWDHCDEGFTLFPFIEETVFIPFHSDTRKVSFSIYFPWKKKRLIMLQPKICLWVSPPTVPALSTPIWIQFFQFSLMSSGWKAQQRCQRRH